MSRQNIKILLLMALILIVAITLFCLTSKQPAPSTITTDENSSTTATGIDTSTWSTYEDKEKGFKFKYPTDLKVLNGKDLDFPENENDATMILPAKYPNIKSMEIKNPDTFHNYKIHVHKWDNPKLLGSSIDETLKNISGSAEDLKQISSKNNMSVFSNNVGNTYYYIEEKVAYTIWLDGDNPEDISTQKFLEDIDNPQLTAWVNDYPKYLKILEGVYNTFEFTK